VALVRRDEFDAATHSQASALLANGQLGQSGRYLAVRNSDSE
jgi:hypothetical protein